MRRHCPACGCPSENDGDRIWNDCCAECGWATPERKAKDAATAARFREVRAGAARARRRRYAIGIGCIATAGLFGWLGGSAVAISFWLCFAAFGVWGLYETWVDSRWMRIDRTKIMRRR